MSEYTPTTGDVRAAYNQLITATRPHELPHEYPCPEFDRWVDAERKAAFLEGVAWSANKFKETLNSAVDGLTNV